MSMDPLALRMERVLADSEEVPMFRKPEHESIVEVAFLEVLIRPELFVSVRGGDGDVIWRDPNVFAVSGVQLGHVCGEVATVETIQWVERGDAGEEWARDRREWMEEEVVYGVCDEEDEERNRGKQKDDARQRIRKRAQKSVNGRHFDSKL